MSEIISSEGAADPVRRPSPQPFPQGIPQPRQGSAAQRSASIYEQSSPVVREDAEQLPVVTGNAPERRPVSNPFAHAAPAAEPRRAAPQDNPAPQRPPARRRLEPSEGASSTLIAAEQLRAAAGEKARQLRQVAEVQSKAAHAQALAGAAADAALADIPEVVTAPTRPIAPAEPAPAAAQPHAPAAYQTPPQTSPPPQPDAAAQAPAASAPTLSPGAQQKVAEWKEIAELTWADASIVLKDIQKEGERYIRANPTRAALTALGVGFVLGVFLKR